MYMRTNKMVARKQCHISVFPYFGSFSPWINGTASDSAPFNTRDLLLRSAEQVKIQITVRQFSVC